MLRALLAYGKTQTENNQMKKLRILTSFGLIFVLLLLVARMLDIDGSISSFVERQQTVLILVALIMFTVQLHWAACILGSLVWGYFQNRFSVREFEQSIRTLSPAEKYILSLFVNEKKVERLLDPNDGAVVWLQSIKVITEVGRSPDNAKRKYRIAPLAMRLLTRNPNLLF